MAQLLVVCLVHLNEELRNDDLIIHLLDKKSLVLSVKQVLAQDRPRTFSLDLV